MSTLAEIREEPNASAATAETLTTRTYSLVKRDIIQGHLLPGAKLKIEELRERYDVGASPIREALSLLTSDGLVDRIEQRGFRVAEISSTEFADILRVRCWIEELALRQAIANGDTRWEEALVVAAYRLSRQPRSSGKKMQFQANADWEACHKAFHRALIAACGSPTLLRYCDDLYDKNVRYRNVAGTVAYPNRDTAKEHQEILDAVLSRDADAAAALLIQHYRTTGDFLVEALA